MQDKFQLPVQLTAEQWADLNELSRETNLTVENIIRRAIDAYLEEWRGKQEPK